MLLVCLKSAAASKSTVGAVLALEQYVTLCSMLAIEPDSALLTALNYSLAETHRGANRRQKHHEHMAPACNPQQA